MQCAPYAGWGIELCFRVQTVLMIGHSLSGKGAGILNKTFNMLPSFFRREEKNGSLTRINFGLRPIFQRRFTIPRNFLIYKNNTIRISIVEITGLAYSMYEFPALGKNKQPLMNWCPICFADRHTVVEFIEKFAP